MRKKIISIASIVVVLATLFALVVVRPSPFQNSSPNQTQYPQLNGPEGPGAPGNTGPLPGVTYGPSVSDLITGQDVKHDISPALRDIPIQLATPPATIRESGPPGTDNGENETIPMPVLPQITDPVRQTGFGPGGFQPQALTPLLNFAGVSNLNGVYPSDTTGDVGPSNYVQMVNLSFQIFDKSGNSLYGPAATNTLWSGFGGLCQTTNHGDPEVLYDSLADRWVLSQFVATSPYGECVAVSTTSNPTGSYYRYFFQLSTTVFYDYPKLGLWPDGYYLSGVRFTSVFAGASAIALDRANMLAGNSASYQEFQTSTSYGVLLPANLNGSTVPPAGEPITFAEIGSTALHLWKFHVDWTTPTNSTLTGPTSLTVAIYNQLCYGTRNCIPQPGTIVGLDGLGDRLMQRLQYRNFGTYETLLVSHNVNAAGSGTTAGVRWYEIRDPNGAPAIYQQGTWAPADGTNRWAGSMAMDQAGNIALGYSFSSSSLNPSIGYTGRLAGDTLGMMTQGETTLIAGTGSQTGSASRWGDYSNLVLDPVDNCTFWFTTEYMASTGTAPWVTRIGSFKFPNCGITPATSTPTATATKTSTPTATASRTPTRTATATATTTRTPTRTTTVTATASSTPSRTTTTTRTPTRTATTTATAALPPNFKIWLPIIKN